MLRSLVGSEMCIRDRRESSVTLGQEDGPAAADREPGVMSAGTTRGPAPTTGSMARVCSDPTIIDMDQIIQDMVAANPHLTEVDLRKTLWFDEQGRIEKWNLRGLGLMELPESFGRVRVAEELWLSENQLTVLPESFDNVRVGGMLLLHSNKLTELPESFWSVRVGKELWLYDNQLGERYKEQEFANVVGEVVWSGD
eukprot:TRINITY_DN36993_c0_g1_i1.p1 TRINITY_DN36993_c0_g1~~TRINITY_DN36993_c0_g1_i1.p1  ORF type:complete len:197 (+),score=46.49 TRINITY_DN36993_c0_g1_i1:153-743(+)